MSAKTLRLSSNLRRREKSAWRGLQSKIVEAGPRKQPDFNSQQSEMLQQLGTVVTNLSILHRRLLAWYDTNRRDLPWRRSADPYRIWLAEVMLQQTRVAAVLEHYRVFLARFPTVDELAAAPLASVLAAWSGLGYYRRARALHRAARQIVRRHHGSFPRTVAELRALPGVGRYTSAAVASIAFGVPVAAVDGNVERVLSRLLGQKAMGADYWALAEALLARRRPGDWNQALMELGATICLPRRPQCEQCPLKRWCASKAGSNVVARGGVESQGALAGRSLRQKCHEAYLLAQRRGSVYLVRRVLQAKLMAGMWELPRLPAAPRGQEPLFTLKHSITLTDYEVAIFAADSHSSRPLDMGTECNGGRWVRLGRIPNLPLTGLARKVLRRAGLI
jgi:A/G-specific adenine glycosylase